MQMKTKDFVNGKQGEEKESSEGGLMGCRLQVRLISMREYKACGAQGR